MALDAFADEIEKIADASGIKPDHLRAAAARGTKLSPENMEKLRRFLLIDEDGRMHVRHEKPPAAKYEALSRNWSRVLTALERGASREQWFESVAAALHSP